LSGIGELVEWLPRDGILRRAELTLRQQSFAIR
jgi:hypothetical protein